jgi:branched-chain amino acid transport system substrate-binding protein
MGQKRNQADVMRITRRDLMQAAAVTALTGLAGEMAAAESGDAVRVGLLTVKTGPLASGGIDRERALVMHLKERNNSFLAGRSN